MTTTFVQFRDAVSKSFDKKAKDSNIYQSAIDKSEIWETYLGSFPEGTNEIFRERQEHDCICCKKFIRNIGRTLFVVDGQLVSLFKDLPITGHYKQVADAMAKASEEAGISGIYLNDTQIVGKKSTLEINPEGNIQWDHFEQVLPSKAYSLRGDIGSRKGLAQTSAKVLKRSIVEISEEAVQAVKELIDCNTIHRGQDYLPVVMGLQHLQKGFKEALNNEVFVWEKTLEMLSAGHDVNIRGTAIGTLMVDLTNGEDLEVAVKKYEDKVSGQNYKRTTALVTPRMKEDAKKTAQDHGFEPSLFRRNANKADVSINDVLFADNTVKPFMDDSVFDMVETKVSAKKMNMDRIQEMSWEDFVNKVLPESNSIELFVENKHESNLMNLIAPVNGSAPCITRWGNNFTWNFNGEFATSVTKGRVKSAGGCVDAPLRVSMSWEHRDDLDLHVTNSHNQHIYYGRYCYGRQSRDTGQLDVDMRGEKFEQVENIFWTDLSKLRKGSCIPVRVHNYSGNSNKVNDPKRVEGFTIEIEVQGTVHTLVYPKKLISNKKVDIANILVDSVGNITVEPLIDGTTEKQSNNIWNIDTENFHKVNMVMYSPNHWDNSIKVGDKHLMFVLENCVNPDESRGFYNEFLTKELQPHRKVFEILASQLKAEYSEDQLAGVGFSTTKRNEVLLKVTGATTKMIKVKF